MKHLFSPVAQLGLEHRIAMLPMTRVRGTEKFECGETAAQYYSERATPGGLIITEGAPVSPETQYEYAAGIYTPEQEKSWKEVVDTVHAVGGKISIQLWHLGRMRHASWKDNDYLKSLGRNVETVSCSATTPEGGSRNNRGERATPHGEARALTAEEIRTRLVNDFVEAAERAKRAGFDFLEIHAAHGYLFDQFFNDKTNLRTDEFGAQSIENRTRALGLVLRAVIKVMGDSKKVAIRISPASKETFAFQVLIILLLDLYFFFLLKSNLREPETRIRRRLIGESSSG
jgi:N-ethylmaleimide reductase